MPIHGNEPAVGGSSRVVTWMVGDGPGIPGKCAGVFGEHPTGQGQMHVFQHVISNRVKRA